MRRIVVLALVALAGCSLDLDRLRRGADASTPDAAVEDAGPDDAGPIDAPGADGGCRCSTRSRWSRELPPVTGRQVVAVHTSDLDRDGAVDILATVSDAETQVFYGTLPACSVPGTFTRSTVTAIPSGRIPALADRDRDGDQDVAVPDASALLLLTGETEFTRWTLLPATPIALDSFPTTALITDLDLASAPDVMVFGGGDTLVQWISMPDGAKRELARTTSEAIAAAATSRSGGSGVITVAFATADRTVETFRTTGGGSFSRDVPLTLTGTPLPTDLVFADVDDEPEHELLIADAAAQVIWVLEPIGGGLYGTPTSIPTPDPPTSITTGDLDADGRVELVVGSREGGTIRIFDARARTELEAIEDVAGPTDVVVTDLDADGLADVVVGGADMTAARITVLRAACD